MHIHSGDTTEAVHWAFTSGEVDSVKLTPSHITLLSGLGLTQTHVGLAVVGGEALSWEQVAVLRRLNKTIRIVNEYGPTEATVGCVAAEVGGRGHGQPLIGRPIENTRTWVVEKDGELAPVGVWGELFVGGAGVARGYLGRDDLTAERFVRPGFASGDRCYRTGDRVRWAPGGELEYGGRWDDQVKRRGHRVEPGEIEFHLRALPGVDQARVIVRDGELVAYVVGETSGARERLRAVLPDVMVPDHIVSIPALPLNASGKLDRNALPPPGLDAAPPSDAARDEPERVVLSVFEQVLGRRLGREENFFDAGGHSLKAVQAANRLGRNLGVDMSLRDVFSHPTAASLAIAVRSLAPLRFAPIPRVAEATDYAVSHAQRRMWVLAQMGAKYHMPGAVRLRGELDRQRLLDAVRGIVRRHEALRTHFGMVDGRLRQQVDGEELLDVVVTTIGAEGEWDGALRELVRDEAGRAFDLERGPLVRVRLVEIAPQDVVLVLTMHHIASDGWSVAVLLREMIAIYQGQTLPTLEMQYRDYTAWQNGLISEGLMHEHRAHWRRVLAGARTGLELPTDRPRPAVRSFAGDRVWVELREHELQGLRSLGQRTEASLFMVLLALVKTLLYRYTGQRDVVVGSPVSGRVRAELEDQVGLYANTVILRDQMRGDEPFEALLERVRETALLAYEHQAYPFDLLVEEVAERGDPGRNPLFDVLVMLAQEPLAAPEWQAPGLEISAVPLEYGESKFDLTFAFEEQAGSLKVGIEYSTELFERPRVERMGEHLQRLALAVLSDAGTPVGELEILTRAERFELAAASGALPILRETLVDRFEAQVRLAPDPGRSHASWESPHLSRVGPAGQRSCPRAAFARGGSRGACRSLPPAFARSDRWSARHPQGRSGLRSTGSHLSSRATGDDGGRRRRAGTGF